MWTDPCLSMRKRQGGKERSRQCRLSRTAGYKRELAKAKLSCRNTCVVSSWHLQTLHSVGQKKILTTQHVRPNSAELTLTHICMSNLHYHLYNLDIETWVKHYIPVD